MKIKDNKFERFKALTWALFCLVLAKLSDEFFAVLWSILGLANVAYFGVMLYAYFTNKKENSKTA